MSEYLENHKNLARDITCGDHYWVGEWIDRLLRQKGNISSSSRVWQCNRSRTDHRGALLPGTP